MGKNLKGKENTLLDSVAKMVCAKKSIFLHFRKHEIGLPISSIMTGTIWSLQTLT